MKAADLYDQMATSQADLDSAALRERAGKAAGTAGDLVAAVKRLHDAADIYRGHDRIRDAARADPRSATTCIDTAGWKRRVTFSRMRSLRSSQSRMPTR